MPKPMWSYRCDYCGGLFKSFKFCENHELACNKNPDGKSCVYCEYGWSKSLRKRSNGICPECNKRFGKRTSIKCDHFVRIDRKQKFREVNEYYKSLGDKKDEKSGSTFEW